ncbi:MAG TPA: hypothetical protein DCR43_09580 [Bacteroidales bacterium]|nr:MAG: hypothetical protein A2X11_11435 [Bacteroidetes bacterium GWE2_42_24]OFY25521.1 MAG: hypothetical protein A2X09_07035 [Bacteroidetes bacterium GWF2_43_11]PKP23873.1 MAG: hypothetical protein CVU06_06060 [Bacteroidetes bacterium HGW-Bacteroidetes-22]HAQ66084.1 hypothetical protein [Bacteroidales bacterium]HBZ66366.1 hypothetical protein [Bacteroidales bacterium]
MKKISLIVLSYLFAQTIFSQQLQIPEDSIPVWFNEVKKATHENLGLWNKDIYGPTLLINPATREIYANEPDNAGLLSQKGTFFTGILPKEINFANTAMEWNGKRWAMIMLPLPEDKNLRLNLLTHELFHWAQPSLGFVINNRDNSHLDQKEGRIYLRLELKALYRATIAKTPLGVKEHIINALILRKYRQSLYSGSDTTENLMELNEGLAEYTGQVMSGRNREQTIANFQQSLVRFMSNPTFVRSFAYQTIPLYGFLLDDIQKGWNKEITSKTDLTGYFIKAFGVEIPAGLKEQVAVAGEKYGYKAILKEETEREEQTRKLILEYKTKFIDQPHLEIQFEQMQISFDPRNIMPLEDKGTVYPNLRITDKWGILTVKNGALVSQGWDKVTLSKPISIGNQKVTGDGWELEMADGYKISDIKQGSFKLIKK